jgi:hypothetical protein
MNEYGADTKVLAENGIESRHQSTCRKWYRKQMPEYLQKMLLTADTKVLAEKPVPVPLGPPQSPH